MLEDILSLPCAVLLERHPYVEDFLDAMGMIDPLPDVSMAQLLADADPEKLEDVGLEHSELPARFLEFMAAMERLSAPVEAELHSVTVRGGRDKQGRPEVFELTVRPGDIVSIVGPTGSGKSRLLADIEWLAQGDTPTGRVVLLNGRPPEAALRFAVERKLVAQLSQNMNFVLDLNVEEFLAMHAESRMAADASRVVASIVALANELAGEPFAPSTALASLSGGQSRALMIADTALLSRSPIVLIDEIENAGIDRRKALQLLAGRGKIVFMATHDPILALLGERRIVFAGGAVRAVLETSPAERAVLAELEATDRVMAKVREDLRAGRRLGG